MINGMSFFAQAAKKAEKSIIKIIITVMIP